MATTLRKQLVNLDKRMGCDRLTVIKALNKVIDVTEELFKDEDIDILYDGSVQFRVGQREEDDAGNDKRDKVTISVDWRRENGIRTTPAIVVNIQNYEQFTYPDMKKYGSPKTTFTIVRDEFYYSFDDETPSSWRTSWSYLINVNRPVNDKYMMYIEKLRELVKKL